MHKVKESKECCPVFNPEPWDQKSHNWVDKPFIRDYLPQLFHMPLPFMMRKVVTRMWNKVKTAGADPDMKDFLLLAYDPSPWKSELYMTVTKEVPGAENVKLTGTFLSMVFDGPFNHVPKYLKEMENYVIQQGEKTKKYYFYFTYCPECARKYGHNYIVAFAEV